MLGFKNLIFPNRCVNCERILNQDNIPLCLSCYDKLTFTHQKFDIDNSTAQVFSHQSNVVGACSLLYYQYGNVAQKIIHANKYYNQPQIGAFLAHLSLSILSTISVDVITIVPSHHKTVKKRGYNQVERFAIIVSTNLGLNFEPDLIKRKKRKSSQTHRNRIERMQALTHVFEVNDDVKQYKNILLIDDVTTTGATLNVCCEAIKQKTSANLYIFTMAKAI